GDDAALLFPPTDALPYEHMSPDIGVVAQRLAVLQRLAEPGEPCVVVASAKALLQPTLTPDEWRHAACRLRAGDRGDPRALAAHWTGLGYRAAPTAEQPGELSQRGGIIDIFPPNSDRPIRLDFFDDELESLRLYDPLTQRSERRIREAVIGPPHEIPYWRSDAALERIDRLALEALRPEVRDEWAAAREHLELGSRFEGRAFYAPFFRTPAEAAEAALISHLPADTLVILSEEREIAQAALELEHQAGETRATQIEHGELPADFPAPLADWAGLRERLAPFALVDLSNQPVDEHDEIPDPNRALPPFELLLWTPAPSYGGQMERLFDDLQGRLVGGERIVLVSPQAARLRELARERHLALVGDEDGPDEDDPPLASGALAIRHGALSGGWHAGPLRLTLLTDSEIFGWRPRRAVSTRTRKERSETDRAAFLQSLKPGDYVVHIEHGIAQYEGLVRLQAGGAEREYLLLRYASGDKLYVPIDQVDRVSRYIGAGDLKPTLTRLGTSDWEKAKRKVRAAIEELAEELLELYAARQMVEGHAYGPDTTWQRELEDSFPFNETDDQLRALDEVKGDMENQRPMDRLICGDVGYGKTEVALRAAFKAVQDGYQVAVLVPTTILAQQHYETFSRRMQAFPITVEMLSRFRSATQQKAILEKLSRGEIDIIIGTHRILSNDVHYKQLGMVVVDEEQRFGVRHKERLKQLRQEVDVLTLTATPIPRTLHMALAGIRDLSVIDTPPDDRVPIKTYVQPYNELQVRDAIMREISRGGQIYFVHNRVQSIYNVANRLQQLVPEARIGVGHGQMAEKELEKVMLQFFESEFDVLVCTTIIESGLDVPSANTIIIDDAVNYGLAQLYQLRGRVGRSTQRGYAYLFYNPTRSMSEEATQRLEAIQEATELGAGFRIAMRDLEIRGAGNLLGPEQSGNIAAIGFDLYSRLLAQAVERLRDEGLQKRAANLKQQRHQRAQAVEALRRAAVISAPAARSGGRDDERVLPEPVVSIDLPITAFLPEEYIEDDTLRLRVYQHIAEARTARDLRELRRELVDRFGPPPPPAERLLDLLQIKMLALAAGVLSIITDDQ
ncbi:MAG TPA: transcription-repair coupling factor, partial [Herpetosiphonaceae bacterium]